MKVIAHRGASSEAPENTLPAFQKAIDLKADFVECDIRLTQDKVPVVHHDPVDHLISHEIEAPTLKQLLDLDFGQTGLMIEIKKLPLEDLTIITDVIKNHCFKHPFYVGSLEPEIVEALDPTLPRIGIAGTMNDLKQFLKLSPKVMAVDYQLLTPKLISKLHEQKIEVWCWTVDDPDFYMEGLDGIITNNLSARGSGDR